MTSMNITLSLLSSCLLSSVTVYADSWELTQNVTSNSAATLSQSGNNNSIEGVNVIKLHHTHGIVVNADQSMTTGGNNLTLSQQGTNSSYQAINYLSAAHINAASQTVSQADQILLEQKNGSNNSIQALNLAITTGTGTQIDALTQTVSAQSLTFEGSGAGNIQAGNYIQADAVSTLSGNVVQDFNVVGKVSYALTGANNLQAGNVVIKNSIDFTGSVTQNFSAGKVVATFSITDGNDSIKAANYFAQKI